MRAWVDALRSGEFRQGKRRLHTDDGRYCCLGVACVVAFRMGGIERLPWERGPSDPAYSNGVWNSEVHTFFGAGSLNLGRDDDGVRIHPVGANDDLDWDF